MQRVTFLIGSHRSTRSSMAYAGVCKDVEQAISLETPQKNPVFALSEEFDVRMAGITYQEYSNSADCIVQTQCEGIERFDYDWALVYVDDCIEFEPHGVQTVGAGNIPTSGSRFLPATSATLKGLRVPNPGSDGRLPLLLDSIARIKDRYGDSVVVCGRAPAPFSAVTLLLGMSPTMLLLYDDPDLLVEFIRFFSCQQLEIGKAQVDAGADALWVGDCTASSRFLSPQMYRRFALEPAKELLRSLQLHGAITVYFTGDPRTESLRLAAQTQPDILAVSEQADILGAHNELAAQVCLMGNIDPFAVLQDGSEEDVKRAVRFLKDRITIQGGHLFCTGEGVTRDTPEANVTAMVRAVRE